EAAVRTEQIQEGVPELEEARRSAGTTREELRQAVSRIEQELALVAQRQRDTTRQLQNLQQRHERLQQESRGLNAPDADELHRLTGEISAIQGQLAEAQSLVMQHEERLPVLDDARRSAQEFAQEQRQAAGSLEAKLAALVALQNDIQQQSALE